MLKRMMHPQHGWHHAYSPQEVERLREGGWLDDEPIVAEAPTPVAETPAEAPTADQLRALLEAADVAYDRRWGAARLQEALDAYADAKA